jgi:hypothetical protein
MLVACRLAGLSALESPMQASTCARNSGRRGAPAISPRGNPSMNKNDRFRCAFPRHRFLSIPHGNRANRRHGALA